MKRGRALEKQVIKELENKLKCKITACGFFTPHQFPIFGASPDGLLKECVVEVKCPSSDKTMKTYVIDGTITDKFKAQVHLQMLCANKKKALFCVASPDFKATKNLHILNVEFNETFLNSLILSSTDNWKKFVYPRLFECTC